jgi:hypothetical protein
MSGIERPMRRFPRPSRVLVALLYVGVLCGASSLHTPAARAQAVDPPSRVLTEGEDLIYNVRYGIFDLGQVRIRITNEIRTGSYTAYQGKANIDSYAKVPFVDLHAIYESEIDTLIFARHFVGRQKDKDHWDRAQYWFEYDKNRVLIDVADLDTVITKRETLQVNTKYHDGLSLFFYARDQLFSGNKVNVPTLIKEE